MVGSGFGDLRGDARNVVGVPMHPHNTESRKCIWIIDDHRETLCTRRDIMPLQLRIHIDAITTEFCRNGRAFHKALNVTVTLALLMELLELVLEVLLQRKAQPKPVVE